MNLQNFEGEVESKIVGRGASYYKGGDVKKLEKVGADEFSATVCGTDKYSVFVKLNGADIIKHECDCPYDFGDVCKHQVAVFYAIRNGNFTDTSGKLNALLENTHNAALRKFVFILLKKDRRFRQNFLREFDENFEEEDDDDDEFFDENY